MKQRWLARIVMSVVPAMAAVAACGGDDGGADDDSTGDDTPMIDAAPEPDAPQLPDAGPDAMPPPPVTFTKHVVAQKGAADSVVEGVAYVSVADLDKDGKLDLVVSNFGSLGGIFLPTGGEVTVYEQGASLASWSKTDSIVKAADNVEFPNQTILDDVDGDGDLDVFSPSGFFVCMIANAPCGGLAWYEQKDGAWVKHPIVTGSSYWYHWVELVDMDGDGIRDLVTAGEERPSPLPGAMGPTRAEVQWFKGKADGDRFEKTANVVHAGGGSFPRVRDLDGDGDKDIISNEFMVAGSSFAWFENKGAMGWEKHNVASDVGPTIQLALVDDLYGDGKLRAIGSNHTNTTSVPSDPESAVYVLTPGADVKQPWTKQKISTGIVSRANPSMGINAAPGIFGTGDIDGDGDLDVLVSGDGDERVFWLEQVSPTEWRTHVLDTGLGQAGGMQVVDLDGDGKNELIVTSYEKNIVLVYERN